MAREVQFSLATEEALETAVHPDSYSRAERVFVDRGRRASAILLGPVAAVLDRLGVTPNMVSSGQLVLGALFIISIGSRPALASSLFLLALVFDALDGVLARRCGRCAPFGSLYDQFCDHAREAMIIGGLAAIGALQPLLAVLYAFAYPTFNGTIYLCNRYLTPLPVAVKSYALAYPAILAYLWFGQNWLDLGVGLSLLSMGVTIIAGLLRLKGSLDFSRSAD